MKRVLFVHQDSNIGGGSFCLLNILKEINTEEIKPIVCLASNGPLKKEIEKLNIDVIIFPQIAAIRYNDSLWKISTIFRYYKVKKSLPLFKRIIKDNKIDIVYLNNMMIFKYLRVAKESGCRTILHCREHWPLNEHTKQLQWIRDDVYKYCDTLIAINRYSASIFPHKRATIVYDWVDMESRDMPFPFSKIFGEDTSSLKVFLFTGGLLRIKGAYQVLKVFNETITDSSARLLLLGYDSNKPFEGKKARFKNFLYKLGLDINEMKCRKIIESDFRIKCLPSTYMITDIIRQSYCMLSYFTIPHANLALAECLSLGTPVIAAKTDESEEYSMNSIPAQLFELNNIDDFKEKIINFNKLKKPCVDPNISEAIRIRMSKENNVEKIDRILSEI